MAAPLAYTEQEIASFMVATLRDVATVLSWDGLAQLAEAVNETLLRYGVSTIAEATDIGLLRAHARVQAWTAAADALASRYDAKTDSEEFLRSQLHKQALLQLGKAESALATLTTAESIADRSVSSAIPNTPVW